MRIIVRAPNWVGDCLLATPFLQLLRERYPDSHITVLTPVKCREIFEKHPCVDDILDFHGFLPALVSLGRGKYDLGLILPNSFSSAFLFYLAGIEKRVGYAADIRRKFLTEALPLPEQPEHRVISYARLADRCASRRLITPRSHPVHLAFPERPEEVRPDIHAGDLVVLNPCAGHPSRRWLAERYGELARRLVRERSAKVVFVGGPAREERELVRSAIAGSGVESINLAGRTTLKELACVLGRAKLLVTSDTAIMHVASAANIPTLVLAGAGDMRVTSPWSEKFTLIEKGVYCSPCVKNFCINRKEPMLCMRAIETDEVFEAVCRVLNGINGQNKEKTCSIS